MKLHIFFFLLILIIASFLRLYHLESVPPSPSLDEVSIGYNAYSILKTGKDEYGYFLPILLRAYDDYRPALYVYLVVPFVSVLGLQVFAVRLPSVLLSIGTVIAVYFLGKALFDTEKNKNFATWIGLFAALFLAISPWHIYISRLGHEVNAGLSLSIFAILFFIHGVKKRNKLLFLLSTVIFSLSFYTYQSEKIFTPFMIILLVLLFGKSVLAFGRYLFVILVIFTIITFPIFIQSLQPNALIRLKATSAFSEQSLYDDSAKQIVQAKAKNDLLEEVINNRRFIPLKVFLRNYFSHYDPFWLVTNRSNDSFKAPGVGLLYMTEFLMILCGVLVLIKGNFDSKTKLLLGAWLIIAPVAPSITTGAPHAMRFFNILPLPQLLAGLGVISIIMYSRKLRLPTITAMIIVSLLFFETGNFIYRYFSIFPKEQSESFQYTLGNAIPYVVNRSNSYDQVIFSNTDNLYQSYMFFLFFTKYDPYSYQQMGGTGSGGFAEEHVINKYHFKPVTNNEDFKNILYVANPSDMPSNAKVLRTFTYLDGKEGVVIYEK